VTFVAHRTYVPRRITTYFSYVSEEFYEVLAGSMVVSGSLSCFSVVSGSLPVSRCFSSVPGSLISSSTYRGAYALELGAPTLTCLSADSNY
jgi:hypothetical protein